MIKFLEKQQVINLEEDITALQAINLKPGNEAFKLFGRPQEIYQ